LPGAWLAKHVQKRRNTIRFLLPAADTEGIYSDDELIYSARCSFLCSFEGWGSDMVYKSLRQDFDRPLAGCIKVSLQSGGYLTQMGFPAATNCVFDIEKITEQGGDIPSAVEAKILSDYSIAMISRTLFSKGQRIPIL